MCKEKVTVKVAEEQSYNRDYIILINACTIPEQPVSRLVWKLNSEKKEKKKSFGVPGFRDLERNQAFFLHWSELEWVSQRLFF